MTDPDEAELSALAKKMLATPPKPRDDMKLGKPRAKTYFVNGERLGPDDTAVISYKEVDGKLIETGSRIIRAAEIR